MIIIACVGICRSATATASPLPGSLPYFNGQEIKCNGTEVYSNWQHSDRSFNYNLYLSQEISYYAIWSIAHNCKFTFILEENSDCNFKPVKGQSFCCDLNGGNQYCFPAFDQEYTIQQFPKDFNLYVNDLSYYYKEYSSFYDNFYEYNAFEASGSGPYYSNPNYKSIWGVEDDQTSSTNRNNGDSSNSSSSSASTLVISFALLGSILLAFRVNSFLFKTFNHKNKFNYFKLACFIYLLN